MIAVAIQPCRLAYVKRRDLRLAQMDHRRSPNHPRELLEAWNGTSPQKMSKTTATNKTPKLKRAYVPATALAKAVDFDAEMMHVSLTDGRILSVPMVWFPTLQQATPRQRKRYEIGGGGGIGLH